MSCAQLVAEYAKADPPTRAVAITFRGKPGYARECVHCLEQGASVRDIVHGSSCFWLRCVQHEKPTVTVR